MKIPIVNVPTSEIFQRILRIRFGSNISVGFVIERQGIHFVVTAAHAIDLEYAESLDGVVRDFEIWFNGNWRKISGLAVKIRKESDVAVVWINEKIGVLDVHLGPEMLQGQDVYIYGYPFEIFIDAPHDINRGLPLPFIQKCTLGMIRPNENGTLIYLNAVNTQGFSGSPICYYHFGKNVWAIAGILSHQLYVQENVIGGEGVYQKDTGIAVGTTINDTIGVIDRLADRLKYPNC